MAKWVLPEGRKPLPDEWFAERAQMQDRIKELEANLAKAVQALGVLADDTNWFDAIEEDGTFSPAWRGTGSPEQIARTALAELTGGNDE